MNSARSNTSLPRARWSLTALTPLIGVCALGFLALSHATMGFEVVSTEDGRRLAVSRTPLVLPATAIHAPQAGMLDQLLRSDGRVTILTFFYSRCLSLCSALGGEFQQLQQTIRTKNLERQVRLLSISFDPRDDATALAAYAQRQHADPAIWRIASVDSDPQRQALLSAAGIVVLPAPLGEFQHNAALYLFDHEGRLVRIDDFEKPALALEHALRRAKPVTAP